MLIADKLLPKYIDNVLIKNTVVETLDDIKKSMSYKEKSLKGYKYNKYSVHIGQRKLMLNEIQFLTKYKSKYCVYAGVAPGNKTYYLSTLFPNTKLILIDPNKFNLILDNNVSHRTKKHKDIVHIKSGYEYSGNVMNNGNNMIDFIKNSNYKIYIIEDYMNNDYAELFSKLDCTFISDIRSNVYNTHRN